MTIKSFTKRALSAFTIAAVAAVVSATPALASQFTFPYFANPQNSCTGDTMVFNGNAHLIMDVQPTDSGFHVKEHFNTEGVTAVGVPSGDDYVISDVTNDMTEFDISSQPTDTHTVHHLVIIHKSNDLPNDDRYETINVDTQWVNGVPNPTIHTEREECK